MTERAWRSSAGALVEFGRISSIAALVIILGFPAADDGHAQE
jgi:hypothetical protein